MRKESIELDKILGETFPILDKGFVRAVDYMGNDSSIVQAARVSYGEGTKKVNEDKALINYLMKNYHHSPMEMCSIKFHVKLPIFVARQWCLSGDTNLHFVNGYKNEYRRKKTIKDVFDSFNNGTRARQMTQKRKLLKYNPETQEIETTHIKKIWESGVKPVYRIKLKSNSDSFEIKATDDHPLYSELGWKGLKDICSKLPTKEDSNWSCETKIMCVGAFNKVMNEEFKTNEININEKWVDVFNFEDIYEISDQGRVRNKQTGKIRSLSTRTRGNYPRSVVTLWNNGEYKNTTISRLMFQSFNSNDLKGLVVRHLDGNPLNNVLNNLESGTIQENFQDSIDHGTNSPKLRKAIFNSIESIEYCGEEMTYDLEVNDDDHNFVAGGIVVHNCRHRTGAFNEISARYTEVKDEFYVPDLNQIKPQSKTNHQGRSDELMSEDLSNEIRDKIEKTKENSYDIYQNLMSHNVAKELSRTVLPVSQYTEFYWTVNLRNLFHFLNLRADSHSQYEIRVYADKLCEIVKKWVPDAYEAFEKYQLDAKTLSGPEIKVISEMFSGKTPNQEDSGMSKREFKELFETFKI